jgi:hypothetical protein
MKKIQDGHKQDGRWILAPLTDITTPKSGRVCYGQRWWAVTENNEVLFFKSYSSPQCNTNRAIVERLANRLDAPQTTPKFVEMAFLPHNCGDYA